MSLEDVPVRKQLYVFDGPDGGGKSTVAGHMIRRLNTNAALLHYGPPRLTTAWEEYINPVRRLFASGFDNVVCDRYFWGELVYPQLVDRFAHQFDPRRFLDELEGSDIEVHTYFLIPPEERLRKIAADRRESYVDSRPLFLEVAAKYDIPIRDFTQGAIVV